MLNLINNYRINDVCLNLPTVVNRSGIEEVLKVELKPQEVEMLRKATDMLEAKPAALELDREVSVSLLAELD
jgi:malate/lactate dehydrogenase